MDPHFLTMADEKSRKGSKIKVLDEIQVDSIDVFYKNRRSSPNSPGQFVLINKSSVENNEDKVGSDSDNGDASDEESRETSIERSLSSGSAPKDENDIALITPYRGDDPAKDKINISDCLLKRRKGPYRVWHKRFFSLKDGTLMYAKSEQEMNRGRRISRYFLGDAAISHRADSLRLDIDVSSTVLHVKTKDKQTFQRWSMQLAVHKALAEQRTERSKAPVKSKKATIPR